MSDEGRSRFATSLEALEASAHVPPEEQHAEQAEAPPEDVVEASKLNRLRLLGIVGDARW